MNSTRNSRAGRGRVAFECHASVAKFAALSTVRVRRTILTCNLHFILLYSTVQVRGKYYILYLNYINLTAMVTRYFVN